MKKILLFALAGVLAFGAATSCKKDDVTYLVTFNSEGGSAVASQTVKEGEKVTRPADPTKAGSEFVEWSRSSTGGTAWNFSTDVVRANITLYAQWDSSTADALTLLNALITEAGVLKEGFYTADSWTTFADALADAKTAAANSGATATQLTAATGELQTAMDGLTLTPERVQLEEAIAAALDLKEGNYTPASWAKLEAALADAEAADEDPDSTAQELTDAYNELEDVLTNGLDFNPNAGGGTGTGTGTGGGTTTGDNGGGTPTATDKSALETAIANAQSLTQSDYTTDSWAKMQTALTSAKNIDADTNNLYSQAQVNAAASNLRLATAQLVHNSSSDPGTTTPGSADKSALKSAMDSASALVEANYTADSWAVMKNDLANAQTVYNNADATQQQVNTALATLQTGINNLKRSTANDGLVSSLLNQLISLVNSLPSASAIQNNPLLAATVIPVATLADTVRDQLTSLLGTDDPQVASLSSTLNGVLNVVGLGNLI